MKTFSFAIQKGGTGKTSISGSVADYASRSGKKTIVVDCDPQGNLSDWFISEQPKFELADTLFDECSLDDTIVTITETLDVIPTFGLSTKLNTYSETLLKDEPFLFKNLTELLAQKGYDVCIFDLSPAFGTLERNVLSACEDVVIPLLPEYFSLDGVEIFKKKLEVSNKRLRANTKITHLVCNQFNNSIGIHKEILEKFRSIGVEVYTVPTDTIFKYAQTTNSSIFETVNYENKKFKLKEQTNDSIKKLTNSVLGVV